MNLLRVLIILLIFFGCSKKNIVDYDEISINGSIAYYKNKKFSGIASIYNSTGNPVAEYYFEEGVLFKQCYQDTIDSCWIEEKIVNGLCDGPSKVNWKNGKVSFLNYSRGFLDGVQKTFAENNKLIIYKTYKNGKLNGIYKEYDTNGNILVFGYFNNNLKDSIWTFYDTTFKKYLLFEKGEMINNISSELENYRNTDTSWREAYIKLGNTSDTIYYDFVFKNGELLFFQRKYN